MSTNTSSDRRSLDIVPRQERSAEHKAAVEELKAALQREETLLREKQELLQQQDLLTQEFEHRLVNGLQLIVSLLTLQSRAAPTSEAAAQLDIAANRVGAIARVHRRLHLLDHEKSVELKRYLEGLCDDLTSMLFHERQGLGLVVTGMEVRMPTSLGIPLGFIVNELIINAVKYAKGHIAVHIATTGNAHALSVTDDGPGLPADFDPAKGSGIGMKITRSLVAQIGGKLAFAAGSNGRGTCVTVTFSVVA